VLVLVGAMMMGEAGHINWTSMPTAVPAFLTMVIQPFTFSIANGIYAGGRGGATSAGGITLCASTFVAARCW
jgi:hypothetical protein